MAGMSEEAVTYANKVFQFSESGERVGETTAERALAIAAAQRDHSDWDKAREHLGEAIRMAKERDERPILAISHFRYAECMHKKGDLDAAREQLDQAEALFRDMGMDWWRSQAEGLRGRIDGREKFVWFAPYVDGPPG